MPENQNIEYKQGWHDDYLKWVCGFANAKGGILIVGKSVGQYYKCKRSYWK
jgi:ATP-dependent DNA helicase RecG